MMSAWVGDPSLGLNRSLREALTKMGLRERKRDLAYLLEGLRDLDLDLDLDNNTDGDLDLDRDRRGERESRGEYGRRA